MIFYTAINYVKSKRVHCSRATSNSTYTERKVWGTMKQRCLNPNHTQYEGYGGRGIGVCEKWLTFEGFYEDMGKRPSPPSDRVVDRIEIDRINNDIGYCKSNCQWITKKENLNKRSGKKTHRRVRKYMQGTHLLDGKYASYIIIDGFRYHIGMHNSEEGAHEMFKDVFKEWYGVEYRVENFGIKYKK